ncbi:MULTISPECIES: hypothetical protein [unclassified Halomonas]|uniref:hypothetical protein n=1 Tax=unclassified Halomonas TaxID=2609666 RepID=UPI0020A16C72|nr:MULTISPECIES: hypothetical protein [unclassified Halomonas]MCP1313548.1 hypothetical protein [Halomonas sp. 707D7]MCP1325569.1 hypothetical protein [Halomonas sp. 707D4]
MHSPRQWIVYLLLALLLSGCASRDIRWMHPKPTQALLQQAYQDLQGFHVYPLSGSEEQDALSSEEAAHLLSNPSLIRPTTPNFAFVTFSGREITVIGYNQYYRLEHDAFRSPMIYRYQGELKRADYTLPHMAPNVGDLEVTSRPIDALELWLLNEQRTVRPNFHGTLKFESWSGRYTKVAAFDPRSWQSIF